MYQLIGGVSGGIVANNVYYKNVTNFVAVNGQVSGTITPYSTNVLSITGNLFNGYGEFNTSATLKWETNFNAIIWM